METASPTRLIIMLYDGAIRFCTVALEAMNTRDIETQKNKLSTTPRVLSDLIEAQNNNLIKAQRILSELMGSLNRESGGDVADNLHRLYAHLYEQLVMANLYDRKKPVIDAIAMLRDLRESWQEVDQKGLVGTQAAIPTESAPPPAPAPRPKAPIITTAPTTVVPATREQPRSLPADAARKASAARIASKFAALSEQPAPTGTPRLGDCSA